MKSDTIDAMPIELWGFFWLVLVADISVGCGKGCGHVMSIALTSNGTLSQPTQDEVEKKSR